jgi:hypothetical protein
MTASTTCQVVLLVNDIIKRGKMTKLNQPPTSSESRWQMLAEFSIRGETGCEIQIAELVGEILISVPVPDQVLMEIKHEINLAMERELSQAPFDQSQRIFKVLVLVRSEESFEKPVNDTDRGNIGSRTSGWGFFITEKRISETESGYRIDPFTISLHLYREGRQA